MKALILNAGRGIRMGVHTQLSPKCMSQLDNNVSGKETILSRQLRLLELENIRDVVITTGYASSILQDYCKTLDFSGKITFVFNEQYEKTNYIYSIYLAREYLQDDLLILHGDLVFDTAVLNQLLSCPKSCVAIDTSVKLAQKDFKAQISTEGLISQISVDIFKEVVPIWPIYKLERNDWLAWLKEIVYFCENGKRECYAEEAFNRVSGECEIFPIDVNGFLCGEVDTVDDLNEINKKLNMKKKKNVYLCFSTDILHGGHIKIIERAADLGKVMIGVLSDEAVASYKHYPLLSFPERVELISHMKDVSQVVEQKELSYVDNLRKYKPDYVVHGDNWQVGVQSGVRNEVKNILKEWGGKLIEFSYSCDEKYSILEKHAYNQLSIPDIRRKRLRKLLEMKGFINVLEVHNGITGLIAEETKVLQDGETYQFDAMWISSLCDSTAKGKPDIELVDMTSRFQTINDVMEVTTKPIIFDGDTGGLTEHFVYTVKSLERLGVSAIIIEDKKGLKKNSLFGTEVKQTQDTIENFCLKIAAGKKAQKTKEFMIIARIESLILEQGIEDALKRAEAYVKAGADGIMIHSRKKNPAEIYEFTHFFREKDKSTPLVVVPTSFNSVTEQELKERGINIVIYANQLLRSAFPAMQKTAESILEHHRSLECDKDLMPIKEILMLIPEDL